MKNLIVLFLLIFSCQILYSQGTYTEAQRKKDKAKLDSICRKSPNSCIYYGDVIGVNSIFRKFAPRPINRTQKICFNKKFEYVSVIDGKTRRGCFYANTITGHVAQFNTNDDRSCDGMNNPQPGFNMIILSKTGESLTFRINSRGEKSFMSHKPLENVPYGGATNFVVKNVNSLLSDFREPFTTLPYFIEGISASSAKYLFGPYHAQRIPLKDYFGAFGLGYYTDGMGNTFISLAVESTDQFIKVVKITDFSDCFDGSKFKDETEEAVQTTETNLKERKKNLSEQQKHIDDCPSVQDLIEHKRQVIDAETRFNAYIKNGGNANSKEALRLGTMAQNVTDQVISDRLEIETKICNTEIALKNAMKESSSVNNQNTLRDKISCYKKAESDLNALESELLDIDAKQRTNYSNAAREKNLIYLKKMQDINLDCNFKKGQLQNNPMTPGAKELGEKIQKIIGKQKRK